MILKLRHELFSQPIRSMLKVLPNNDIIPINVLLFTKISKIDLLAMLYYITLPSDTYCSQYVVTCYHDSPDIGFVKGINNW
mmetsp:Transcript_15333/g.13064  ORF Transcript_15333/g.13064 Transcript_15333/m.13064 type:complete len:81 (-) Transcript_15333:254-496(-)